MQVEKNKSLKKYNSFGIDVNASFFASFNNVEEAKDLLNFTSNNLMVLGGGSNILFTKDFDGLVIKNEISGIDIVNEDDNYVYVKAGAGVKWHDLVLYCIDKNLAGIENLSLIPGNVGASPMQNIGAYGVEIKDVFYQLEALHVNEKKIIAFNLNDCAFCYRESVFKRKYKGEFIITSVTYRLNKIPRFNTSYGAIEQELERMGVKELSIKSISQAVINIRSSKLPDPAVIGNAGSFFKNPEVSLAVYENLKEQYPQVSGYALQNGNVKLAAGWLIEHAGPAENISWKGYRMGDAGCHAKQALVLVNYGDATGGDIYNLSEAILQSVYKKYKVQLEREVNIM